MTRDNGMANPITDIISPKYIIQAGILAHFDSISINNYL